MALLGMKYAADVRTLCFTAIYFMLFATLWIFEDKMTTAERVTVWSLTSFFSFIGAVAVHNAIHTPVFHSKTRNAIFQVILSLTYGHPVSNYVPGHNLSHHQHTQNAKDVMRTTKVRFAWHFLNGLTFAWKVGYCIIGNDAMYFEMQKKLRRPIYKQMRVEQVIVLTICAILIILDARKWFFYTLLPHIVAKFCIITLNMLQHDGCDMSSKYNFSRNFVSPILNFFAFNNGYHAIHHLQPGMHWSLTKDAHKRELGGKVHPSLEQKSILVYIFKTFIFPGIRIDYLGKPLVLPPAVKDEPWFYEQSETYSSKGEY